MPGFLSAGRYVALKGAPKYLAIYELEDHNVLRSAAYLDTVKYQPSTQRSKIGTSRVGRNFLRNTYRQIFPIHTDPIDQTMEMAPVLQMGRIDIPGAVGEEFNDWYNTVYIPTYLTVPGVLRARRFVAIEGQPKYLTLYEFEHAGVPEGEAWSKARASNPWTRRMSPNLRHDVGSPGLPAHLPELTLPGRCRAAARRSGRTRSRGKDARADKTLAEAGKRGRSPGPAGLA